MGIKERCSVCGNFVSDELCYSVFRLMKDCWSHRENWEEVLVICEKCFAHILLPGSRYKGAKEICRREDLEE